MTGYTRVGSVADFARGKARRVVVDGVALAVFREGPGFVVAADACPHMGASLAEGRLEAGHVECAWHGWRFDARTGRSERRSGAALDLYETRVVSGELWVRRAPEPPPPEPGDEDEPVLFDPEKHLRG